MGIIYHIIEWIDGEHGIKIISYKLGEYIKLWVLTFIK